MPTKFKAPDPLPKDLVTLSEEDERILTNLSRFTQRHWGRTIKFKLTEIAVLCYVKDDHSKFSRDILTMMLTGKMEAFDNFQIIKIFRYLGRVKYNA